MTRGQKVYKCILLMADQFSTFSSETYALVILKRAVDQLELDILMSPEPKSLLKDLLYERIFNICQVTSENGIEQMYRACGEMSSGDNRRAENLRTKCIKMFFERVITNGNVEPLKTHVFDNKMDVRTVLADTFVRLEELFEQRQRGNGNRSFNLCNPGGYNSALQSSTLELQSRIQEHMLHQGVKEEILVQLNLLNVISSLYNWNDHTSRFLWSFQKQIEQFIKLSITPILEDFERIVEEAEGGASQKIASAEQQSLWKTAPADLGQQRNERDVTFLEALE